jgi:hypothetical protein
MAKKTMTFEQMAAGRLAAIHTIMDRYTKAGIVMVPSFAAAGLQFEPEEFHDAARLAGWKEEEVTIGGVKYWGYRGGK